MSRDATSSSDPCSLRQAQISRSNCSQRCKEDKGYNKTPIYPQPPRALVLAAPSDPEPPSSLAGVTQEEQQQLVEVVATFDAYRIVAIKGGRGGVLCRLADDDTPRMFSKMVATVNASVTKAASTCGIIKAEAPAVAETRTKLQTKSNKAKPEVFIKHIHG